MYIELKHRHYGVHRPIKHIEIPCDFSDVYIGKDRINEKLLLENIPDGWLPTKPSNILLTVDDNNGGIGMYDLYIFRPWAKYFDSYVLGLCKEPMDYWDDVKCVKMNGGKA